MPAKPVTSALLPVVVISPFTDGQTAWARDSVGLKITTTKETAMIRDIILNTFTLIPTNCYAKFDGFFRDAVFALDGFIKLFANGLKVCLPLTVLHILVTPRIRPQRNAVEIGRAHV